MDEAVAVVKGNPGSGTTPLVRIHSQCLTGDVFHSLRCDCRLQLELALDQISQSGCGMVIYEMKEGRGIGIINKLRAYELQDHGADTVEANEQLGLEIDARDYELPAGIVRWFGVSSIRLISNNPAKVEAMERFGIRVTERVSAMVESSERAQSYLKTKVAKLGHLIDGF